MALESACNMRHQKMIVLFYPKCKLFLAVLRDHLGYYDALGLEPGAASLSAIKEAFRQAALIWHPDRQKVGPQPCEQHGLYGASRITCSVIAALNTST